MNGRPAAIPRRILAALIAFALAATCLLPAACTTSREIVLPVSGINSRAYVIDCSGASLSWSHCYRKAGETCPLGYTILDNSYKHGERVTAGDALQLVGNSALHRRMAINCRTPGSKDPSPAQGGMAHDDGSDPSGAPPLQR